MKSSSSRIVLFVCLGLLVSCGSDSTEKSGPGWDIDQDVDQSSTTNNEQAPDMVSVPNTQCDDDIMATVTIPAVLKNTLPEGKGEIDSYSCTQASGSEHTYKLVVPKTMVVRFSSNPSNSITPVLALHRGCDAAQELYCAHSLDFGFPSEFNSFLQARLEQGTYYLTVDHKDDESDRGYSISIEEYKDETKPAFTCEEAMPLPLGEEVRTSFALNGTTGRSFSCFQGLTAAHFYRVEVPAMSMVVAHARGSQQHPELRMYKTCDGSQEQCSTKDLQTGEVQVTNRSGSSQSYILAVEGVDGGSSYEDYSLVAYAASLKDNATCMDAEELNASHNDVLVDFQTTSTEINRCNGDLSLAKYYSIEIPPKSRLIATRRRPADRVDVEILKSCQDEKTCLDARLGYLNEKDTPQNVILRATAKEIPESPQVFTASVHPLARNATCDQPTEIKVGDVLENQDALMGGDPYTRACKLTYPALTSFYLLKLRIGDVGFAKVRVTPDSLSSKASIQLLDLPPFPQDFCSSTTCVAMDDSSSRATPAAEVQVNYASVGSGEEFAHVLVAVSMSPYPVPRGKNTFKIEVIPQD